MNRKIRLSVIVMFIAGALNLSAQTNISTETDSLSYSYGFSMAKQGLEQYIINQLGISKTDTQKVESFLKGLSDGLMGKVGEKSYTSGVAVAGQISGMADNMVKQAGMEELNMELINQGIRDVLLDSPSRISNTDEFINSKMKELNERKHSGKINESKAFMEENKSKPGVTALPSGLQYKILVQGNGEIPTREDKVKVHYRGTLTDGTQFDSSYDRGEPIVFGVEQVIAGWTEALQLMPVGSKWELFIPYDLAYGERDTPQVPAYSNLIFEVELLDIEKENSGDE